MDWPFWEPNLLEGIAAAVLWAIFYSLMLLWDRIESTKARKMEAAQKMFSEYERRRVAEREEKLRVIRAVKMAASEHRSGRSSNPRW